MAIRIGDHATARAAVKAQTSMHRNDTEFRTETAGWGVTIRYSLLRIWWLPFPGATGLPVARHFGML